MPLKPKLFRVRLERCKQFAGTIFGSSPASSTVFWVRTGRENRRPSGCSPVCLSLPRAASGRCAGWDGAPRSAAPNPGSVALTLPAAPSPPNLGDLAGQGSLSGFFDLLLLVKGIQELECRFGRRQAVPDHLRQTGVLSQVSEILHPFAPPAVLRITTFSTNVASS